MNTKNFYILTNEGKIWISKDQKTKIKFHRIIGPDNGILRYSINGELKEISTNGMLSGDDKSFRFYTSGEIWQVRMNDDITIDVKLPGIDNLKFKQINDPKETD